MCSREPLVSKEATIQARVSWAKTAEDCCLAIHNLAAMGETLDATKIQLVIDSRLGDVVRVLQARTYGHASPNQVLMAVDDVLMNRVKPVKVPLVSIGQGDYKREIYEEDVAKALIARHSWRSSCSRVFRRLMGVA